MCNPITTLLLALGVMVAPAGAVMALQGEPTWFASPPLVAPGEPVTLTLCNSTPDTVVLANSAPWWVESLDTQTSVFTPFALTVIVPIPPGGCFGWVWDQKDDGGSQVPPGNYLARIEWSAPGSSLDTLTTYFEIVAWPDFDVTLTGDPGSESVQMTLRNVGSQNLLVNEVDPWHVRDEAGVVYVPPSVALMDTIRPEEFRTWQIDPLAIGLAPGAYDMWIEFFRETLENPESLRDRFAIGGTSPGQVIWHVDPFTNTTRSAVALTFTNATTDTVWLPSYNPWWIENASDEVVYSMATLFVLCPVPPGTSRSWGWLENDYQGRWVEAGTYTARIRYSPQRNPWEPQVVDRDVVLYEPQPQEPCVFVQTDSTQYATGSTVTFDFTNCYPDTVGMRAIHTWWVVNAVGVPVYAPSVLWALTSFETGAGFTSTWDQTDFLGNQVPPGVYAVVVQHTDEYYAMNSLVMSAPFGVGIPVDVGTVPAFAQLAQNVPNPFNPATVIRYNPAAPGAVTLCVFDPAGRLVRTLVRATQEPRAGGYVVTWDGRNDAGDAARSGVYLYRLKTAVSVESRKMVLIR